MSPNTGDLTPFLLETVEEVVTEMDARLQTDLSERDHLAVMTAIGKAAWKGALRGVAEHDYATRQQVRELLDLLRERGLDVSFKLETVLRGPEGEIGPVPDPWLEAYGAEGEER